MFMWKSSDELPKQSLAEIHNRLNNLKDSMTHRLITSFLTYLDNIINTVPSHFWLSTLSRIIFDYLFAQSSYLCVCTLTQTHRHTVYRRYTVYVCYVCTSVCVWCQSTKLHMYAQETQIYNNQNNSIDYINLHQDVYHCLSFCTTNTTFHNFMRHA